MKPIRQKIEETKTFLSFELFKQSIYRNAKNSKEIERHYHVARTIGYDLWKMQNPKLSNSEVNIVKDLIENH